LMLLGTSMLAKAVQNMLRQCVCHTPRAEWWVKEVHGRFKAVHSNAFKRTVWANCVHCLKPNAPPYPACSQDGTSIVFGLLNT